MPLPSTMTPIATATATGSSTGMTFSSIPQTYTDLVIVCSLTAGNTKIVIFDLDTNTVIYDSGIIAASIGWNNQTINQTFVARRIFISVETDLIDLPALDISTINNSLFYNCSDYNYCFDCGCGTVGKITGMVQDGITSEQEFNPSNTFGVSAIFSIPRKGNSDFSSE